MISEPETVREPTSVLGDRLAGSLLGTAVGDAIGLPYEGLSRRRVLRRLRAPLRHRFVFGRGMVSDDTEHACIVAQALIATADRPECFQADLARRLRWWLLMLPAGTGCATAVSILRLWCGFAPERSGVRSAGNGPLMRAPLLGAAVHDDAELVRLVRDSTRITHTDPRAEWCALAVALATREAARSDHPDAERYLDSVIAHLMPHSPEIVELTRRTIESASRGQSTLDYAADLGLERGVSGFVLHTTPIVLHAWMSHPGDLRQAVAAVIQCGGDTDTTAAIVGGIVGAGVGRSGIPADWLSGLLEWPRTAEWMQRLAEQLAESLEEGNPGRPPSLPAWGVLLRNVAFLCVVLAHGTRRLLPPW